MKIRFLSARAKINFLLAKAIALSFAFGGGALTYYSILFLQRKFYSPWLYGLYVLVPLLSYWIYQKVNAKYIRRAFIYRTPFPEKWRALLKENVVYYNGLSPVAQRKFEKRIQVFLAEKKIEAIKTTLDDKTRILVAASAVIPTMGFDDADYDHLGTILIYPQDFNRNYELDGQSNERILGLVGDQYHYNAMILSKPALFASFLPKHPGRHVGIHEFVHLIDKGKGVMNGIPATFLNKEQIRKWIELMHKETFAILNRQSNIDPYAATNSVEFLAVLSEYFFTYPEMLAAEHPELYQLMRQAFRQDPQQILKDAPQAQIYREYLFQKQSPELYINHFWNPFLIQYNVIPQVRTA
jgi:Mlc titration factor MtfA (ptsG expression regulator)